MQFNNLGCLVPLFIFMFIFLGFSKLLFTTPMGLILLVYIIFRMFRANSARNKVEEQVFSQC